MEPPSRRSLELNEVHWWSNWARLTWLGSSGYVLASEDFREPFFNRAGALTCAGVGGTAAGAEKMFAARRMDSTVLVFDSCNAAAKVLGDSGYKQVDTMTVFLCDRPMKIGGAAQARINSSPSADSWTRAYLQAFYEDETLTTSVTPIVGRLLKVRAVTLLEARIGDKAAGVLAIFRTRGIAGVYCVGTVPEHRRQGVAEALLHRAQEIADEQGRKLILQSLSSDGSEGYYTKRGFVPLYSKRMLWKQNSNAI